MNWLVVKWNCCRFSGTTLLKLASFGNTANNTSKYQSLIPYPRDERLSKVCPSSPCSKRTAELIRLPLLRTELALQSWFLHLNCLYRAKTIQASFLYQFCQYSSEIRRQKEDYMHSLDQRLESITSRQEHNRFEYNYRNSNRFHTAGSLEHKFTMAESKNTTFKVQYFQFAGPKLHFSAQDRYSRIG